MTQPAWWSDARSRGRISGSWSRTMTAAASSRHWSRGYPLIWVPSSDYSAHRWDCNLRPWPRPQPSNIGGYRTLRRWPRCWRTHRLGWSLSMPSSTAPTAAPWTGRSLRSEPRSDLAGGDHVVLVVFQHPASGSPPQLNRLTMHRLGEPPLRIQPSWIVVAPTETHMACHQFESEAADPEVVRLDDLEQVDEMLLRVRCCPTEQLVLFAVRKLTDLGDFVAAVVEHNDRRCGFDDAAQPGERVGSECGLAAIVKIIKPAELMVD